MWGLLAPLPHGGRYQGKIGFIEPQEGKWAQETCAGCPNIKPEMRSFKSNENIHKKEGGSYYVVSANKASSVTL